jgi:DNA-binding transcriptional MerR regulator
MRIGEVARELGVSADTVRYYERGGFLSAPKREENGYRDYGPVEIERLRLLLDLRRLDLPLDAAAKLAGWCQTGHCTQTTAELPQALAAKRDDIRRRITGLQDLEARLTALEGHLGLVELPMAGTTGQCCAAADVVHRVSADAPAPSLSA